MTSVKTAAVFSIIMLGRDLLIALRSHSTTTCCAAEYYNPENAEGGAILLSYDYGLRKNSLLRLLGRFLLQSQERFFIVSWDDTAPSLPHELLQPLRRAEPGRVITS